jgi:serine/threonine protein kinase
MGKPTFHSGIPEKMRSLYDRKIKRYQSPEAAIDINQMLSRSDDVWALGCIFLEFIIWILCGNAELLSFTDSFPPKWAYSILHLPPENVASFKLWQSVNDEIEWIKRLLDPDGDTKLYVSSALKELLGFLWERIFVPVPLSSDESPMPHPSLVRAEANELHEKLVQICANPESSYFHEPDAGHTRPLMRMRPLED